MNATLSEVITLTSFGNQFLRVGKLEDKHVRHPFFQMCSSLDFREIMNIEGSGKVEEQIVAQNPLEWFDHLKHSGCLKMRLYYVEKKQKSTLPEPQLSAFAEFIPWLIECIFESHSDYWVHRNEVVFDDQLRNRIWTKNYGKIISRGKTTNLQMDPIKAREKFKKILMEIRHFAERNGLEKWAKIFNEAHYTLINDDIARLFDALIVSDNYELINNQLMLAVGKADVFGGMGSWNDLGFFDNRKENEAYQKLSDELYRVMNEAIIAAINHDRLEI